MVTTLIVATTMACAPDRQPDDPPVPGEFLVATADSAFWVTRSPVGVHVRGVPITMAVYGGRFYEVFVATFDQSYTDAVFVGERLYVRELVSGDSVVVFEDSAVVALANQYVRDDPDAVRLAPGAENPEEPVMTAFGETDILGVRGPYVLVEHRCSMYQPDAERADTIRTAIDLRTVYAPDGAADEEPRTTPTLHAAMHDHRIANDSSFAETFPHHWRRAGFSVTATADSVARTVTLTLHDSVARQSWPVRTVSTPPRIYWLDAASADRTTRRALRRAFDEAAAYDPRLRFTRFPGLPVRPLTQPSGPVFVRS